MRRLKTAVCLLGAGIVLLLAWGERPRLIPEGLHLPASTAMLRVDGPDFGGFCRSPLLRYVLLRRVFGPLLGENEKYDYPLDFTVRCAADAASVRLDVRDRDGRAVASAEQARTRDADAAYLLARGLAKDPAMIAASLDIYRRDAADSAHAGAERFAARDWNKAARDLFFALESDVNPVPLYFGLYAAHAHLGHPRLAFWYLLCFLREARRSPAELNEEQLAPLRELASAKGLAELVLERDATLLFIVKQRLALRGGRVNEIYELDRKAVEESPWTVAAYDALVRVQELEHWDALASSWRRRRDLALAVLGDPGSAAAALRRLSPAR